MELEDDSKRPIQSSTADVDPYKPSRRNEKLVSAKGKRDHAIQGTYQVKSYV
jgi:hypothetical protein